jgi:NADPH:quinone reductase-like Zn-dependent oxidoreductase
MNADTSQPETHITHETMRAVAHTRFGRPADALETTDLPIPTLEEGQVLIDVEAAGVGIGDWLTVAGLPWIARPMFGIRTPKQPVAGHEVAGRVAAVGAGVTRHTVGDDVFGFGHGAFAQYSVASQDAVVPTPDRVTSVQAAAIPVAALTALQALRDAAGLRSGQTVLVIGASGAVGTYAVQIAKAMGAEVTGVASTRNVELVQAIGADHVIDYTRSNVTDSDVRYDVIVDLAGNRPVKDLRRLLTPTGTLVMVGGDGGRVTMGFGRTIRALMLNPFVSQTLTTLLSKQTREDLVVVADMAAAGTVTPIIDRTYPLAEAVAALEHVGARHTQGRTVLTV